MAYTTPDVLFALQPDLASASGITVPLIEQSIADAEAEINGYIGGTYALPFASVPPLLKRLANDIAIYRIFTNRSFTAPPPGIEGMWSKLYEDAIAILKALAAGEMVLTTANGTVIDPDPTSGVSNAWSSTMGYVPTFGEGPDQGFTVDRNKVENEISRRVP